MILKDFTVSKNALNGNPIMIGIVAGFNKGTIEKCVVIGQVSANKAYSTSDRAYVYATNACAGGIARTKQWESF